MRLPVPTLLLPSFLRPAVTPLWLAMRPLAGRMIQVCSAKAPARNIRQRVTYSSGDSPTRSLKRAA